MRNNRTKSEQGSEIIKINDTIDNFSDSVSSAIQEISNAASTADSYISRIGDVADKVGNAVGSAKDIAELYTQCVALNSRTRQVEAVSRVMLANTVAKFKLGELFLTQSFCERNEALQHYYKVLDVAIEKGDTSLILSTMSGISGIVTTSPLDKLEKLYERFDDPNDSLLDF